MHPIMAVVILAKQAKLVQQQLSQSLTPILLKAVLSLLLLAYFLFFPLNDQYHYHSNY